MRIDDYRVHPIIFKSGDKKDLNIYGFFIESDSSIITTGISTIVYCHGNKNHLDFYWARIQLLAATGHRVFSIDYRGYGLSEGTPTEKGMYQDVRNGLQVLIDSAWISDSTFIMYGFSLGSAPATELTSHWSENPNSLTPMKLILESPYSSAEMLMQDGSQLSLPGEYLLELKVDNADEIKNITAPFLWIHGIEDDFLEIDIHGQVVFDNYAGNEGYAKKVPRASHNDVLVKLGFDTYINGIKDFIDNKNPFGLTPQ